MKVKPTPGKNLSIEKKYTHDHMSDGGSFKRKKKDRRRKKKIARAGRQKVKSQKSTEGRRKKIVAPKMKGTKNWFVKKVRRSEKNSWPVWSVDTHILLQCPKSRQKK